MSHDAHESVVAVGRIDAVPKILEVVCRTTGLGFAAVARVTPDRWIACAVRDEIGFGLAPGGELEVATTICDGIRDTGRAVVIDHVAEDPDFRDHPTPKMYGFQSYVSVPIRHRGQFFGTLCAIDPRPATVKNPAVIGMFELFADLIGAHLDADERLARSEAALADERVTAELRDQFIAILGHDLRNPLAAIGGGVHLLRKGQSRERSDLIVGHMETSVRRMTGLISDIMDFAKGRLGGGMEVQRRPCPDLASTLESVVHEFRVAQPSRDVRSSVDIAGVVDCDPQRLAQLLSNLVGNALTHGSPDHPVSVIARVENGVLQLSVVNRGRPISGETKARLFQPFRRGPTHGQGLGLGLYIASEIAKAHGGALRATSDEEETRFTLSMPVALASVEPRREVALS